MTDDRSFRPPSPEAVARLLEFAERQLTVEDFNARVHAPMTPEEREEGLDLIRWFKRRYPTPAERLAYCRRAYERWKRAMPRSR
jgi:hypothetical protein